MEKNREGLLLVASIFYFYLKNFQERFKFIFKGSYFDLTPIIYYENFIEIVKGSCRSLKLTFDKNHLHSQKKEIILHL